MSCSQPTEFSAIKPKFCGECGQSFVITANAATNPSKPKKIIAKAPPPDDDEYEDEDDDRQTSNTVDVSELDSNKLGVEVEVTKPRGEKLEDILASAGPTPSEAPAKRNLPKPPSKKQFWEDFKKQAGTLRPK